MSKNDFVMHQDLLKSVIFQQAGSITKAVLEAIQNSLDAGAKIIKIQINRKGFIIFDNGEGMNKEQIDECFKVFGHSVKANDDSKIGKFAMGRGQIFAFGYTKWLTQNYEMRINAIRSLTYRLKETDNFVKGTEIRCLFYKALNNWELDRTISSLKQYVIPTTVEITINGEGFDLNKIVSNEYSDENFEVFTTRLYNNRIFAQQLFIKEFESTTPFNINCLNKMRVNMARNSFIEDDEMTTKLYTLIQTIEKESLMTTKRFDATLGKKVLEYIVEGKLSVKDFESKKIIEMADGTLKSLKDIQTLNVMFGGKNRTSDRAIQEGYTVINDSFEYLLTNLSNKSNGFKLSIDSRRPSAVVREGYTDEITAEMLKNESNDKAVYVYYWTTLMNEKLFGNDRTIKVGTSDVAKGWTDGYHYICINKTLFTKSMDKRARMNEIFELLVHEYSHDEDDTNETDHDSNFYKRYHDLMSSKIHKVGFFLRDYDYSDIVKMFKNEVESL